MQRFRIALECAVWLLDLEKDPMELDSTIFVHHYDRFFKRYRQEASNSVQPTDTSETRDWDLLKRKLEAVIDTSSGRFSNSESLTAGFDCKIQTILTLLSEVGLGTLRPMDLLKLVPDDHLIDRAVHVMATIQAYLQGSPFTPVRSSFLEAIY